jgi:hypothetical protein
VTAKRKAATAPLDSLRGANKIPLVTTNGSHMVFSAPKTRAPLPVVTGPVSVSFKHEDSIGGMAVGPVIVTAREPYEEWLKIHGAPHTSRGGETRYLVPFGSKPDGRHDLGWATKHVALEIAAHYGIALEEF